MIERGFLFALQIFLVILDLHHAAPDTTRFPAEYSTMTGETERCYDDYGCFSLTDPWVTESRPVPLFPISHHKMNVSFPVFTRRNMRTPVILNANDMELLRNANINPRGPFYFITHGYLESGHKAWLEDMMTALLRLQGNTHATVIIVDWKGGSSGPYPQAVANIRLVGAIVARFIHNLYEQLSLDNLDNFHFIGHSLGAHLAGYTGSNLQEKYNLKLGRITGLDPAEPQFSKTDEIVRLDRSDAIYVDIIHSDANPFIQGGFGITEAIGHVDFFPNGGSSQPGCSRGLDHSIRQHGSIVAGFRVFLSCNHVRSYQYFTESINPSCPFFAIQCPSYEDFVNGSCFQCSQEHLCIPFGYHSQTVYSRLSEMDLVQPDTSVTMYTKTGEHAPFCRVLNRVTIKFSDIKHESEAVKLYITFVDVKGKKGDRIPVEESAAKYYEPGTDLSMILGSNGSGFAPYSAILELEYESKPWNPFTWRILSSPELYVDYIRIQSLEYNSIVKVCPPSKTPITEKPTELKQSLCPK